MAVQKYVLSHAGRTVVIEEQGVELKMTSSVVNEVVALLRSRGVFQNIDISSTHTPAASSSIITPES